MSADNSKARGVPDQVLTDIADYVKNYRIESVEAYRMARYSLIDALGCAVEALSFPECTKLLGPPAPGLIFPLGARVPGTQFELDPVNAAFNIGTMIRWLDFNDSFLGHPSDNIGGILATADYLGRRRKADGGPALLMREVLTTMIKAYEIHGILSLENDFGGLGFDDVTLAKVAATAPITHMLGGSHEEIVNAVSNAWADGVTLKIYRRGNSTGSRKSWAGGDATSRAVWLSLMALKGEMGYPLVLTTKNAGFYDVLFKGVPFEFQRPYGNYVVENLVFKFVPSGNHGQSAAECAFKLHPLVRDRIGDIEAITIRTQNKLIKVMDKKGPLFNAADRDHCAQYVIAVGLIQGKINTTDFEDEFAADPRIDQLREKMTVVEDPRYTRDHIDPEKRSKANAIEVRFKDGSSAPKIEIEYPLGHPRRRAEACQMLETKFSTHLTRHFSPKQKDAVLDLCMEQEKLEATPVDEFVEKFVVLTKAGDATVRADQHH